MLERPPWLETNFTEPRVLLAVRDLCEPGDCVFDVGANFGGITVGMSRTVGPRGVVCGFEANPSITARCQTAVNANGCGNVQLYHGAVFSRSGESITLYLSDNAVGDSIHYRVSERTIQVPTLALDDFVQRTKLVPQFVKMDIEGAEIDALEGFERTIAAVKPIMILEQSRSDNCCLEFLRRHGYDAIDLSTYAKINEVAELPEDTLVTDILYAPTERLAGTIYKPGVTEVLTLGSADFERSDLLVCSKPLRLKRGRYVVHPEFGSSEEGRQEMFCGVKAMGREDPLMRYHGHSDSLARFGHRWVFEASGIDLSVFFQFAHAYSESFKVDRVRIYSVDSFKGRTQLFY